MTAHRFSPASRLRRASTPAPLSPQAHSTWRLALVAFSVLATVVVLVLVALQARAAERALDDAAQHTLHDYGGYAGRLMASELLRRFSDQRARILAPVIGRSGHTAPPELAQIVRLGESELGAIPDPVRGYFRLHLATGRLDTAGAVPPALASRIADTLRILVRSGSMRMEHSVLVLDAPPTAHSVGYAAYADRTGRITDVFGFTYDRALRVAAMARTVFAETPLLPPSFGGARWNYDTTRVRPGEVLNDPLLTMRVTDRAGRVFWTSPFHGAHLEGAVTDHAVISTSAGGLVVESRLRPGNEPWLIPSSVRRATRSTLGALLALVLLLAGVSLVALRSERAVARARRAEAMQQLALGLRHELNNALASVLLNAEVLGEDRSLDPAVRERLEAITEQAERMRDVLRRLERGERLDVVVPYLDEGFMVDLSAPVSGPPPDR